jgi:P27 family predicted phage terminase small subunit
VGRPTKSAALHDLQGTELRTNLAVSAVPGALPRPDRSLSKEAKKKFRQLAKQLHDVRQAVTAGDADLLTLYCSTWERLQQANENIRTQGLIVEYVRFDSNGRPITVEKPNISLKIAEVCERTCLSYLARLGLTPKDREHVRPTAPRASGREKTARERLEEEQAELEALDSVVDEPVNDEGLLADIAEINATVLAEEPLTPAQELLKEVDEALEEK